MKKLLSNKTLRKSNLSSIVVTVTEQARALNWEEGKRLVVYIQGNKIIIEEAF